MGYLFHILTALGAEGLGELGFAVGWVFPWGLVALLPVPHLLSGLGRDALLTGRFARAAVLTRALHLAPPALYLILVCVFGWVESTHAWTSQPPGLFAWPRPALVVALAPYVVFELLAIDAQARMHDSRARERRAVRSFQTRMFCSALLPLALYLGLSGLVAASESLRVHVEQVVLFNATFVVVLLSLLALALPTLIRNTWETAPLPASPQRDVLEHVAARASFRARELLVWRTGNLMANAAIVGVWPRSRVVLFSDSLLSILSLRELAAVFGHEIGHALCRHVWIFVAWAMAFFMSADLATGALAGSGDGWTSAALLAILGGWALSFGWMSRRFELEADLFSLELLDDPESLILALERVGGRDRERSGWRHFSTRRRVDFVLRAAADGEFAARFRARLRRFATLGVVFALIVGLLEIRGLVASYTGDRVQAELSLGDFEAAAQRAEGARARLEEPLLELARFAGRLAAESPGSADPADLERLRGDLERSLASGDLERAGGLVQLAVLRGAGELWPLAETFEALGAGQLELARARLAELDPPWRAALAPWLAPQ